MMENQRKAEEARLYVAEVHIRFIIYKTSLANTVVKVEPLISIKILS
ncbi:MAG: hypothetical protein CLLPBCKN_001363 [Chroococcidiopsis cubana SAG 39.79]|nr:hypothetical protein [Chroococcidiopsis cubana SAG 39.79]